LTTKETETTESPDVLALISVFYTRTNLGIRL